MALGNFFRVIEEGGANLVPASKLLQVYAREQNRDMLRDFYYSDDRRVDSAVLSLSEAATMSVSIFPSEMLDKVHVSRRILLQRFLQSKPRRNSFLRTRNALLRLRYA